MADHKSSSDGLDHWSDTIEWWNDPGLAWRRGFDDGYVHAYREIFKAFSESIGCTSPVMLQKAIDEQIKLIEQRARRVAYDKLAVLPWVGDNLGTCQEGIGNTR